MTALLSEFGLFWCVTVLYNYASSELRRLEKSLIRQQYSR